MEVKTFSQINFQAIGTRCQVILFECQQPEVASELAQSMVSNVDLLASFHRSDSELSYLNTAENYTVPVSETLFELLLLNQWAFRASRGAIDATIGRRLVEVVSNENPKLLERRDATPDVDGLCFENVALDSRSKTVTRAPGVIFDLGGLAKAWLADQIADAIEQKIGCGVLVNLGGDIATRGPVPIDGWRINVTDDFGLFPESSGMIISIGSGGLATSSTKTRQFVDSAGNVRNHIVVKGELDESNLFIGATAIAPSACMANFYTLASLASSHRAPALMASYGVPALLRTDDHRMVKIGGWPPEQRWISLRDEMADA